MTSSSPVVDPESGLSTRSHEPSDVPTKTDITGKDIGGHVGQSYREDELEVVKAWESACEIMRGEKSRRIILRLLKGALLYNLHAASWCNHTWNHTMV